MFEAGGGFVAWVGASLVVLADGRRGLASGIVLAAAGLAAVTWQVAGPLAAGALAAGGVVAAAGRWRAGAPGWQIMPPGSTPRLVLCVAAALVALWVALAATGGAGAGLRFAALVSLVLAPARILWSAEGLVELSALSVLALAVGAATGVGAGSPDAWPCGAAGAVAAGACWLPVRPSRAA